MISKSSIIVEIIEYIPFSMVIKTVIDKTAGKVSAISFDSGEPLTEKKSPFDTFIQVIEGKADIVIGDQLYHLFTGQSLFIPAYSRKVFQGNEPFKMISTMIISGSKNMIREGAKNNRKIHFDEGVSSELQEIHR